MTTYHLDANHHELSIAAQTLGMIVIDNAQVKRAEPGQLDCWWGLPNPYGGPAVWIWVEYKSETGRLRPEQQARMIECLRASLPVEIVRSTADVERVYRKYLARMGRFPQEDSDHTI
jgi:hypothetical protein